ncbi:MAG: hypothetical protein OXB88_08345 [Bacteriovoracales bacterium]|nr:hypothetical protein [Bacteriovoracales bacterium]
MPKKSPKGRIVWNPTTVEIVPVKVSQKRQKQLLTELGQIFYDLACQFSEEEKRTSSTNFNLSGPKSEVRE